MIRATKLSSKWYLLKIGRIESDIDSITEFVESFQPVILASTVEEIKEILDLPDEDFEMIEDDE